MDKIKIKISDFTILNDLPLWRNYRPSKFPNRHLYFRDISNPKSKSKRPFKLTLMLCYDALKDTFTITFNGSIRKWYFGGNTRRNLSKSQLTECITLLSGAIEIKEQDLRNAKITQLETGITLLLGSEFKNIINCFIKHRNFTRELDQTTLYFKGKKTKEGCDSNYKYKFYEKLLEINKNDKSFYDNPIKMNVHKKFVFFRFEIVIKKVSGVIFYKEKARTFGDLVTNWTEINLELINRFESINFVDLISNAKNIDVNKIGKRDFVKYLQFKAIAENGFIEEFEKFEIHNTSTNRSTKTKAFIKNYELFLEKKKYYRDELNFLFKKKINTLV
jgi:hypothetical protein